jgi:outer membrane protein assembly factor BamB
MVHQGGIVVAAGRQSAVDGGVFIYKLDPRDGSILWKTRLWNDPDVAGKLADRDLITPKTRNRRVNDLLVSNGENVCLWITPLANEYAAGELVDIETRVIDARAMKFSVSNKDELRPLDDATWLWSASSGGLMSRRYGSVGRHDGSGVNYAHLNAVKICRLDNTLYALGAGSSKSKELRAGLTRIALSADGRLPEKAVWKASGPKWGTNDAMIVAGERIYVSHVNLREPEPHIQVYATDDGAKITDLPLDARVIKDGMAAACGRLYVSCTDGSVVCLGE